MVLDCQNENNFKNKIFINKSKIEINACDFHTCKNKNDPFSNVENDTSTRFHINDFRIGIYPDSVQDGDGDDIKCYCSYCRCRNKNCKKDDGKPKQNIFSDKIKRVFINLQEEKNIYYCSPDCFKEDKEFKFGPIFKEKIFTTETNCNVEGTLSFNKQERKFILSSLNKLNKFMLDEEEKKEAEEKKKKEAEAEAKAQKEAEKEVEEEEKEVEDAETVGDGQSDA